MNKKLSEQEVLDEADPSPENLSLKKQLRQALTENKNLKMHIGDDIALFDYVKSGLKELKPYTQEKLVLGPGGKHEKKTEHQAVFIVTDAHCEESVKSEEMEGACSYDWATFEARMQEATNKCIEITTMMRQSVEVTECHVFYLGDWFCGQIHPIEQGFGTSLTMPVALPSASVVVAEQVMQLSKIFTKVNVWGLCGNHGRDTPKMVTKMMADRNWDMSVYLMAREYSRAQKNVFWNIPQSIMAVAPVMNWKCLLTHGNTAKRGGGDPILGVARMLEAQHKQRRTGTGDFDFAYVGHWHTDSMLNGDCTICPSLIGSSQFSRYLMHASTPAGAMLYFFTEKHGRTCTWRLNLE